eukprot:TRINITY_DN2860_c0_g1_i1.p1 TRINITY_DN2860_c0_g1~~TRINITY_DN2860_c0_g1_i1.p1  ORF type:complete len:139 (-),score=18.21 TRINITY_DN2860_c0_g1_i1:72-488(-)
MKKKPLSPSSGTRNNLNPAFSTNLLASSTLSFIVNPMDVSTKEVGLSPHWWSNSVKPSAFLSTAKSSCVFDCSLKPTASYSFTFASMSRTYRTTLRNEIGGEDMLVQQLLPPVLCVDTTACLLLCLLLFLFLLLLLLL